MLSWNPKKWGLPRPWYFRFKFDRGHARWVIELQENGYEWHSLTSIQNDKIETLDFKTLDDAITKFKELGLGKVYCWHKIGWDSMPECNQVTGNINLVGEQESDISVEQKTNTATPGIRAVSTRGVSQRNRVHSLQDD